SPGDIVLPQFPTSIPVSLEQKAIIACRASKSVTEYDISYMYWNQQRNQDSLLTSGFLAKFSGSGCKTDITLTLHAVEGAYADIVMTQSPTSLAVSAGEKVTISCKSSQSLLSGSYNYLA
ncbi:hypothetical protein U0070_005440, partial [Myodes glareolus]